jgi:UDP-N-acetylglucosamine 2-epimerase (non-hydrolysing)
VVFVRRERDMWILNIVGTRPNLVKIAPLVDEMNRHSGVQQTLLHTGQHYDDNMSRVFFEDLGLPQPDIYLGVGSGSHAQQTARVMVGFEQVCREQRPDLVIVVGDVNSTLACAVTAAKLWIPVAHVEAGLRSYDRTMPEEINRIVTDTLSDLLFTTSRNAGENLRREGIPRDKIFFVGNVMIDTLKRHRLRAEQLGTPAHLDLEPGHFALLTLHRPSNVDEPEVLSGLIDAFQAIQEDVPVLFPAHPRTVKRIAEFGFEGDLAAAPNLRIVDPLGYLEFLDLMMHAQLVLTDSGGIQEETTILGVPCLTLRQNTERPITVTEGTNIVVGTDPARIVAEARKVLAGRGKAGRIPELWDGHAAERIVRILVERPCP